MAKESLEEALKKLGEGTPSDDLMTYLDDKAKRVEEEALESARKLEDPYRSDQIKTIASMRLDRGNLEGTIDLVPEITSNHYRADIYIEIASKYIDRKDYAEAIKTLEKAHETIEEMKEGNEYIQSMRYNSLLKFYHDVLGKLKEMKKPKE